MGSKNSWNRGLEAEAQVRNDLKTKSCEIIGQRIKTPFAEVDILFRSAKGQVVLLEVKALSKWVWLETRLTQKQSNRLKRAAIFFEDNLKENIQVCVAYVIEGKIFYFNLE